MGYCQHSRRWCAGWQEILTWTTKPLPHEGLPAASAKIRIFQTGWHGMFSVSFPWGRMVNKEKRGAERIWKMEESGGVMRCATDPLLAVPLLVRWPGPAACNPLHD
jgi:hypothetical protein